MLRAKSFATVSARLVVCQLLFLAGCDTKPVANEAPGGAGKSELKPRPLSDATPTESKAAELVKRRIPLWIRAEGKSGSKSQSSKPQVDAAKTKLLADSIFSEAIGDGGAVEVRDDGILLHPGGTLPTRVDFDVRGKFGSVRLHAWMGTLPQEALANKWAGTAGVRVLVDGQSLGWCEVNRRTNQSIQLDLSSAEELSVVADNYDNLGSWDWSMVGLE